MASIPGDEFELLYVRSAPKPTAVLGKMRVALPGPVEFCPPLGLRDRTPREFMPIATSPTENVVLSNAVLPTATV
jgi:hypothetical protein